MIADVLLLLGMLGTAIPFFIFAIAPLFSFLAFVVEEVRDLVVFVRDPGSTRVALQPCPATVAAARAPGVLGAPDVPNGPSTTSPAPSKTKGSSKKKPKIKQLMYLPPRIEPRWGMMHADECIEPDDYEALRARGLVVSRTIGDLIGIEDPQQLEYAVARRAVLVSHDGDFITLDRRGAVHCGIVLAPKDTLPTTLAAFCSRVVAGQSRGRRAEP